MIDFELIDQEVRLMERSSKPKWVVLARKYLPELREVFWNGSPEQRTQAQDLIRKLSLEQTLPLNEIGRDWTKVGDEWYEADSYTGEWVEENDVREGQRAPSIWIDPLPSRITQAYQDLGASQNDIEQAIKASSFNMDVSEKAVYEDGEIPSVPLAQEANDMQIKGMEAYEIRMRMQSYTDALHQFRQDFFEYAKKVHLHGDSQIDGRTVWIVAWRSAINASRERADFLKELQACLQAFEPQYVARVFLSFQNDDFGIEMADAKLIKIGNSNLYEFIETFWHLIEDDLDGIDSSFEMTDDEIYEVANRMENEILDTFPVIDKKIENTRSYMQGMLQAVSTTSNLKAAGFDNWRAERWSTGQIAYQRVFDQETAAGKPVGQAGKLAWSAFWQSLKITGVVSSGLKVENANGKSFKIGWSSAVEKLNNHRLPLTLGEAGRLKKILKSKGWGKELETIL